VQALLGHFGYLAVFAALVAGGVGVPIPEELTQLTVGVLAHEGILDLRIALPVVWVGIVLGDTVLYLLARRHGPRLLETRAARRFLTPAHRAALTRHFARHAFLTVAIARHTGGVRFPAFALAGAIGVPFATFVVADALSSLVSVPFVVGAGYLFWHHLAQAKRRIRMIELSILGVVALAIAIGFFVRKRRRAMASRAAPSP